MRFYDTPIGKLPSVTTILDTAMSSYYLTQWAADLEREMCIEQHFAWLNDNENPDRLTFRELVELRRNVHKTALKDAGSIGSLVHNFIQAWCEKRFDGLPEDYMNFLSDYYSKESVQMLSAWFQCLKDNKIKILESERMVYSPEGYAGTLDAIGTYGEEKAIVLFDWKTSSAIYDKHWIQAEAYRRAYMWMTKTEPVARCIVRLCKEEKKLGTYEMIIRPLEIGTEHRIFFDGRKKQYVKQINKINSDHEIDYQAFLACKKIYERVNMDK